MNTASRMESTGTRNRVHISKQTADLLVNAGKKHWIKRRDEKIVAKGLGELETFWLVLGKERRRSEGAGSSSVSDALSVQSDGPDPLQKANSTVCSLSSQKMARMIEWNVDVLLSLLLSRSLLLEADHGLSRVLISWLSQPQRWATQCWMKSKIS
jgi:hypothetical protein